jgi:tetratricopeptide (TPR) repeat protein
MAIGREDYEERKESKIDAFNELARKNSILAEQEAGRARQMGSVIPFGQPILVGHHSEKKHRALLKRVDGAYRRAGEADEKAAYYQDRAATAGKNRSISGDDTEAVERYKDKLAQLEKAQEHMKAVNKAWKQGKEALYALGLTDLDIEKLKAKMPSYETKPCPTWMLSNNSAEIRRVKEKLEELSRLDKMEAESAKFPGGEMRVNLEINRIQFIFDDIPSPELRKLLKSRGSKWSPSEKAWQRQRTLNAVNVSNYLLKEHFNK